jgi:DNA-binding transcriptional MerR regulator
MTANRTYTIRQLTKEFSVTARTLRFYEDEGLIAPERRGQSRIYSGRDRARVILILRGRRVGFSLAEIREILDLYNAHDGGVSQFVHSRRKFTERIATLQQQKIDIEESLVELRRGIAEIDQRLAAHPADSRAA